MTAIAILLSIVVAAALGAAGAAKLVGHPAVMRNLDRLKIANHSNTIAGAEVTLAATLVVGLVFDTFRRVGALGVIALMSAAFVVHIRAKDPLDELAPAAILLALALVIVVA